MFSAFRAGLSLLNTYSCLFSYNKIFKTTTIFNWYAKSVKGKRKKKEKKERRKDGKKKIDLCKTEYIAKLLIENSELKMKMLENC